MQDDLYSKAVMTVIAAALSVIAGNQLLRPAEAQGGGCGISPSQACYVEVVGNAVEVRVINTVEVTEPSVYSGKPPEFFECVESKRRKTSTPMAAEALCIIELRRRGLLP